MTLELTQLQLDCIMMHFKALYVQDNEKRSADFGEPCINCPHKPTTETPIPGKCRKMDWLKNLRPFFQNSSIPFSCCIGYISKGWISSEEAEKLFSAKE